MYCYSFNSLLNSSNLTHLILLFTHVYIYINFLYLDLTTLVYLCPFLLLKYPLNTQNPFSTRKSTILLSFSFLLAGSKRTAYFIPHPIPNPSFKSLITDNLFLLTTLQNSIQLIPEPPSLYFLFFIIPLTRYDHSLQQLISIFGNLNLTNRILELTHHSTELPHHP